ncbi:MAG: hypothetical protein HKL99_11360 [Burkholderiales bacterium]|nr:hypothetical protein [Burkholderiales bacterium]
MNPYTQGQAMPGMEFFQSLLKGSGMPTGFANWMAPTVDPKELEQKITDLKAVLQWLEANARLTQATIQALEVQRMTLSALKTMNVDLGDLAGRMTEAMQAGAQAMGAAASSPAGGTRSAGEFRPDDPPEPAMEDGQELEAEPEPQAADAASALPGVMDPMQWWNAVSQQFSQVATQALRESPWPMPPGGAAAGVAGTAEPAPRSVSKPAARKAKAGRHGSGGPATPGATTRSRSPSPAESAANASTQGRAQASPRSTRPSAAAPRPATSKTRRK